jgi:hypothetical protein
LQKCRGSYIGDGFKRGISGGERKRVSIACELITEPSLLLLDEPTTGLDSNNAENVALGLRNLADEGRLVVTTIHQPSSEVLELFDQILILHKGKRVFDGPYEELRPFFGARGIDIPLNCNCIEFLINLINIDRNSVKLLEEQVDKKFSTIFNEYIISKIEKIIDAENAHDIVPKLEQRDEGRRSSQIDLDKIANPVAKVRRASSILLQKGRSFREDDFEMLLQDNRDKEQSLFRTMATLYSRGTTCFVRNPANFSGRLIQVIVNIFVCLLFFFRLGYGTVGMQNREGMMYQFMMMFCFMSIQMMLLVFNENTDLLIKEIEQGLYSPGAYFWNVTLVNAPMNLVMYYAIALSGFFICNMNFHTWMNLVNFLAITTCVYFIGDAWGTF